MSITTTAPGCAIVEAVAGVIRTGDLNVIVETFTDTEADTVSFNIRGPSADREYLADFIADCLPESPTVEYSLPRRTVVATYLLPE
jgi:hypothetical protein